MAFIDHAGINGVCQPVKGVASNEAITLAFTQEYLSL